MRSLNANALGDIDVPEREPIWGPGVAQGNLIQVFGPRGISKTRFCMSLGFAFASGTKFLSWPAKRKRVLYIDGELGKAALVRRIHECYRSMDVDFPGEMFCALPYDEMGDVPWNLSNPREQQFYEAEIKATRAEVVFIDNLLTCSRGMDNRDDDLKQWLRIQPWLARLRSSGLTVIFVHHTGKSGDQLGTSTRETILDAVIAMRKHEGYTPNGSNFELHFTKHRDFASSDTPPLLVEYIRGDDNVSRWFWSELGDELSRTIQQMWADGFTRKQIAKELGLNFAQVSRVIPRDAVRPAVSSEPKQDELNL